MWDLIAVVALIGCVFIGLRISDYMRDRRKDAKANDE